jgi:hypothetical protein
MTFTLEQVNAQGWGSETALGITTTGSETIPDPILPVTSESPWIGGEITLASPATGGEEEDVDCYDKVLTFMFSVQGEAHNYPFFKGYCKVINVLDTWENMFNWDFYVEVLLGFLFISYLITYFKRLEELF